MKSQRTNENIAIFDNVGKRKMKPLINSKNQFEFKRNSEFIWFVCQMFVRLDHIESATKLIHTPKGKYATAFVPKKKSEIVKLPFQYKDLYEKFHDWMNSDKKILYLNEEEMKIFKVSRDTVFTHHVTENSFWLSQNSFVKYYIEHYLEIEQ